MVVDLRLVAVGWILAESDLKLVGFDLRLEQLGWRLVVSDLKSEQPGNSSSISSKVMMEGKKKCVASSICFSTTTSSCP